MVQPDSTQVARSSNAQDHSSSKAAIHGPGRLNAQALPLPANGGDNCHAVPHNPPAAPRPSLLSRMLGYTEEQAAARRERQLQRQAEVKARKEHQVAMREVAKQHRREEHGRRAKERVCNGLLGGVAWGFDPTAGATETLEPPDRRQHYHRMIEASAGPHTTTDDLDKRSQALHRWNLHREWGLEYGGPGQEGKLSHGSLKSKVAKDKQGRTPSPWRAMD